MSTTRELAASATVSQLRTAIKLEPRPEPDPTARTRSAARARSATRSRSDRSEPQRSISKTTDEESTCWRITLPHVEAAKFDAALASHLDALVTDWKRDHADGDRISAQAPPLPNTVDAFLSLIEAGWDTEVARRPHGQRTTVVAHVDVDTRVACLHLGPLAVRRRTPLPAL